MSFKQTGIFPANPVTVRGASTKLSAAKDKVIYTNGKTVVVWDTVGEDQTLKGEYRVISDRMYARMDYIKGHSELLPLPTMV
ncbi:hypothetical protein C0991_010200 [Blastosporella zonata]|nr:hypothetical protein C0991_010200 [Blastosporella zonata]